MKTSKRPSPWRTSMPVCRSTSASPAARPYGVIAATFRQATFEFQDANLPFDVDLSGGGLTLGGGLKYFFSRAVGPGPHPLGQFTGVQVGGVTVNNALDLNAISGRLAVGLSWFPSRR